LFIGSVKPQNAAFSPRGGGAFSSASLHSLGVPWK
jgi:hypothetical protein